MKQYNPCPILWHTPLLPSLLLFAAIMLCGGCEDQKEGRRSNGNQPADSCEVLTSEVNGYEVFEYEASRIDATATYQGERSDRVCSRAGVLPWSNLTFREAREACQTMEGFHLCLFEDEWLPACTGPHNRVFPYGTEEEAGACNDYKQSREGCLEPAGKREDCVSLYGALDMVGNLWEWTSTKMRQDGRNDNCSDDSSSEQHCDALYPDDRGKVYCHNGKVCVRPRYVGGACHMTPNDVHMNNNKCVSSTYSDFSFKSSWVGFRCCRATGDD